MALSNQESKNKVSHSSHPLSAYFEEEYQSPNAWCIIVIIFCIVIAGAQLLLFKQTRNRLHLALFASAILVKLAYILELADAVDASFIFPVASWITIIILTYLLSTWMHSMLGCLQTKYSKHFFKFSYVGFVLFSLTKLAELIYYILCVSLELNELYGLTWMLVATFGIEILSISFLGLLCIGVLRELRRVVDPELILKRRQLIWLILMYLAQETYLVCSLGSTNGWSLFTGTAQEYISILALVSYFVFTLLPRDAVTSFDKAPNLPTVVPGQSTVEAGKLTVVTVQSL